MGFKAQLHEYAQWRDEVAKAIEMYRDWCDRHDLKEVHHSVALLRILDALKNERITLAFTAEFSRDKTELINALFFAEMGFRLLPATTDHTMMCPAELFYDAADLNYIRLLDIETRIEETSLMEFRKNSVNWKQIELDFTSPAQMQKALAELLAVKKVSQEHAQNLGLWNEIEINGLGLLDAEEIEVPCWRYALINLSHPLLKQGLCILDAPSLSSLRVEPELTLNILPGAEAIIFVLATDRGVTKSGFKVWRNYITTALGRVKVEFAVVMNKIDTLWDDLEGDASVVEHVSKVVELLDLDEPLVFPVSAKQALVAKIKSDADLLKKSRLASLESYLSNNVLLHRRKVLKQAVTNNIGLLLNESLGLSEEKYKNALEQLDEFKKVDCDNAELMSKLLIETRERQQSYLLNVENFQSSHQVFVVQAKALVNSLSRTKVDAVIQNSKDELTKSLTTYRLKLKIQALFDDLRGLLHEAVETSNETRDLMKEIHKKFGNEYGFSKDEPNLFSMSEYQFQLELILEEGEIFRSSTKTTLTKQSVVVKKLYTVIISRVRVVFDMAHQDANQWSKRVFVPLVKQIKEHKKQIDSRLHMLRKISGSKEGVAENIQFLEAQLVSLVKQYTELQKIISGIKIDGYTRRLSKNRDPTTEKSLLAIFPEHYR